MTDYLVRSSALQGIRHTVEEQSGDADTIFRRAALSDAELDPESWISYRSFLMLLEDAAHNTHCPHFGLQLSRHQGIEILGTVGFVIQQAPNLYTALKELARHFGHHNQGGVVSIAVEQGLAQWRFVCHMAGKAPTMQQDDLVAGIAVNLMRLLWRPDWSPNAVYLPHAPPQDIRPYKERFNCPILFNWDSTIMTFDADLLDTPIREANPQLHRVLEDHLGKLQRDFPSDYCGQIRYLINQAMTTGDCSIERVASHLAVNKRTLQRQLKSHDTSYKDLLEEVRFNIAQRYLREASGSLTALADMLCYSELSAFSNAFRQRFGMSPRDWKKQQAAG